MDMDLMKLRKFEKLSPFEIKDELIKLATKTAQDDVNRRILNAGRGNPNWIATEPREALLPARPVRGHREQARDGACRRASAACRRRRASPAGSRPGSRKHADMPGAPFLADDGAVGGEEVRLRAGHVRPRAGRLDHRRQLSGARPHAGAQRADRARVPAVGDVRRARGPTGKFDLYAVEGGTAAMCYIFKSLKANRLLNPGDTIALGAPIFTPYLEMPHLEDYDLNVVNIAGAAGEPLPVHRRGAQEAARPEDQGVLPRQPGQPDARRAERRARSSKIGDAGEDEAARPDPADRRRLRHLRPGLPLAARRVAAEHHRRLLLLASTSAAPAGASASSRSTRTTSSTR